MAGPSARWRNSGTSSQGLARGPSWERLWHCPTASTTLTTSWSRASPASLLSQTSASPEGIMWFGEERSFWPPLSTSSGPVFPGRRRIPGGRVHWHAPRLPHLSPGWPVAVASAAFLALGALMAASGMTAAVAEDRSTFRRGSPWLAPGGDRPASARAGISVLDPGLGADARPVGVLEHSHLGHEVRRRDEVRRGAAARQDHVEHLALGLKRPQDVLHRELAEPEGHVDLVQHDHVDAGVGHELAALGPGGPGGPAVPLLVLGVPVKSLPHAVPLHLVAKPPKHLDLPGGDRPLDVLDDPHAHPVVERPDHHAEGGGALALPRAREHDDEPLCARGLGPAALENLLDPLHAQAVLLRGAHRPTSATSGTPPLYQPSRAWRRTTSPTTRSRGGPRPARRTAAAMSPRVETTVRWAGHVAHSTARAGVAPARPARRRSATTRARDPAAM